MLPSTWQQAIGFVAGCCALGLAIGTFAGCAAGPAPADSQRTDPYAEEGTIQRTAFPQDRAVCYSIRGTSGGSRSFSISCVALP